MKLWLLKRVTGDREPVYDCCDGFAIRAETAEDARVIASKRAGDEGAAAWLEPARSSCDQMTEHGDAEILLCDFHAG